MEITASMVKTLREKTGAGMMDCKKALVESDGNEQKAVEYLRMKGIATAAKRGGRVASEGIVSSYIHTNSKIGVMVEINCETDFVARTDEFRQLAKDLSMQIAATNPIAVRREDLPADLLEGEREIHKAQALEMGKPEKVVDRIVEGRIEKFFKEVCLLEQVFVKDTSVTVMDIINDLVAKLGEKMMVRRFVRYQVGEGIEEAAAEKDTSGSQ